MARVYAATVVAVVATHGHWPSAVCQKKRHSMGACHPAIVGNQAVAVCAQLPLPLPTLVGPGARNLWPEPILNRDLLAGHHFSLRSCDKGSLLKLALRPHSFSARSLAAVQCSTGARPVCSPRYSSTLSPSG